MTFKNIFDSGGDEADSAKKAADALNRDIPGAGTVSGPVRDLESKQDPWLVRQTAHGAFDVMGFLNPLLQKFHDASADQLRAAQDPASTFAMASSAMKKAAEAMKVEIRPEDLPNVSTERASLLLTTELGQSEGLAVDPARNKAYVGDLAGQKLSAVDLATGAKRVVASSLGDIRDVTLDGNGTAYAADYGGGRVVAVDLTTGSVRTVASVLGAYGVALDGAGKAYVANWNDGQLIAVDLKSGQKNTVTDGLGRASAVALAGNGKAYVGQREGGALYEVDLAAGTKRLVTTLPAANATRVALDGAGNAYVADSGGGRLYLVNLADGAQRVVASGLGHPYGLALDGGNGRIYVSNQEGQLWRLSQRVAQALGGIGKVVP
ncbi:PQQ-binding-like beta-propeller repeat protein [Streptomyces kaniharaensis]|uniref:PQQ-binding-like beta-propeller repeat protein n=1 Tax=Streptomyces kaniharaensis TaxID=212423 RepID=A0A6N7KIA1_9ACTN|nr:PQQ-binding-like beta-propeller repeat protein [Streptomyces kaniharaensis]MQS11061.1 PQQ-binding-like beta-propeller repeat protein [Streptomyces kaniharaensis]